MPDAKARWAKMDQEELLVRTHDEILALHLGEKRVVLELAPAEAVEFLLALVWVMKNGRPTAGLATRWRVVELLEDTIAQISGKDSAVMELVRREKRLT